MRDPLRPQAPPSLAFRVEGTVAVAAAPLGADVDSLDWGPPQRLDATWVVVDAGDHHLIAGDAPAP